MRNDSLGLFWNEVKPQIEKKTEYLNDNGWEIVVSGFWAETKRLKLGEDSYSIALTTNQAFTEAKEANSNRLCEPPNPVWLSPSYLPNLVEARAFDVDLFTDAQLVDASYDYYDNNRKHELVFDVECYENYFLVAFKSVKLKKVIYFELSPHNRILDVDKLAWVFDKFCTVGFNSRNYDKTICALALKGCTTQQMKAASNMIIEERIQPYKVLRTFKTKKLKGNSVDVQEVAPLFASLKIYGGRMGSRKMQDLPFDPNILLSKDQIDIMRFYCINDLDLTMDLFNTLNKQLALRETMSIDYGEDLRSKSDAQIAEVVINKEVTTLNGHRSKAPFIEAGRPYRFEVPQFMNFVTPGMQHVLNIVRNTEFLVSEFGNIGLPENLKDLVITIGPRNTEYTLGVGGLHSKEKKQVVHATATHTLREKDVASYYPYIILNLGLYPEHLGPAFLTVYRDLVERRIAAKLAGDKVTSDALKITINGTFGKLGSPHSILYAPNLLMQVTMTGQLSLLMLIEALELNGIPVVSANTDGIVVNCPNELEYRLAEVFEWWEGITGFDTDETMYQSLYSKDVNNYAAVLKADENTMTVAGEVVDIYDRAKVKGIFTEPGLKKNPQSKICIEAILHNIIDGTPLRETIINCKDVTKFLSVRTVNGGAVKLYEDETADGLYLGKAIRWYYGKDEIGIMVYAKNGKKVPKSDGAVPLMEIQDGLPEDLDYDWYEAECNKILAMTGIAA